MVMRIVISDPFMTSAGASMVTVGWFPKAIFADPRPIHKKMSRNKHGFGSFIFFVSSQGWRFPFAPKFTITPFLRIELLEAKFKRSLFLGY
jgi:hypothetical protein